MSLLRSRWAAVGAAVAVTLGGGGIGLVSATTPTDAVTFVPITPCRVIDTRPDTEFNVGPKSSPVGPEEQHSVTATGNTGNCTDVPNDATAVSLNVTALNATLPTFIAVYATGETTPDASSLNPQPGAPPTPNAVTTELSAGGEFTIFNKQGSVDVLADINGYYIDHHHDDRYYTKGQVDGAVADASAASLSAAQAAVDAAAAEVVVTEGVTVDVFSFDATSTFSSLSETFETTTAGHLLVDKLFVGSGGCGATGSNARGYFLAVDGIAVKSSLFYVTEPGTQRLHLSGVTEEVVQPGSHTIDVAWECLNDDPAGGGTTVITVSSIIVIPS